MTNQFEMEIDEIIEEHERILSRLHRKQLTRSLISSFFCISLLLIWWVFEIEDSPMWIQLTFSPMLGWVTGTQLSGSYELYKRR